MLCIRTGIPVFNPCDAECDKEASLYDVISYILATGRDYATNQETTASRAARVAFVNSFPEEKNSGLVLRKLMGNRDR